MTEAPENKLVFLDLVNADKALAVALLNFSVQKVSVSFLDSHVLAISGKQVFKILRV